MISNRNTTAVRNRAMIAALSRARRGSSGSSPLLSESSVDQKRTHLVSCGGLVGGGHGDFEVLVLVLVKKERRGGERRRE